MKEPRKSIFNWDHISDEPTEEQVEELKSYYHSYHKKCWAYKQALKTFKKWRTHHRSYLHLEVLLPA